MSNIKELKNKIIELENEIKELESIHDKKQERFHFRNKLQSIKKFYINDDKINNFQPRNGVYEFMEKEIEFDTKWKGSFFNRHRLIAETYSSMSLHPRFIKIAKSLQSWMPMQTAARSDDRYCFENYNYYEMILVCEAIIPHPDGPVLKLSDPFGTILSQPSSKLTLTSASEFIDKLLYLKVGFHNKFEFTPVKDVQFIKFPLYDS